MAWSMKRSVPGRKALGIDRKHVEPVRLGVADLALRRRRATARPDGDAIDRSRRVEAGRVRNQAGARPLGQQRVFDPGRPDDEGAAILAQARELSPHGLLRCDAGDIEQHDLRAPRDDGVHAFVAILAREQGQVDQADGFVGLPAQVKAKVGLGHRRHRMARHHGMAIDAVGPPLIGCEEIAESSVALQLRRADHERNVGLCEQFLADVDRAADASNRRAGVEGRTDLVVANGRVERLQPCQRRGQMFVHPGRRFAAAGAGEPDRASI